jgi:hypothetical protein
VHGSNPSPANRQRAAKGGLRTPSLTALEDAMHNLVSALVRHRARPQLPTEVEILYAEDFAAMSKETAIARDIVRDPVDFALRKAMKKLGRLIALRCASYDELHELVKRVSGRDSSNYWKRYSPIAAALNEAQTADGGIWLK